MKLLTVRVSKGLLACAVLATINPTQGLAAEFRLTERPIVGEYIVVLKESAAALDKESRGFGQGRNRIERPTIPTIARSMSTRYRFGVKHVYGGLIRGFAVKANDRSLARLLADPNVAYVEENGRTWSNATQSNPVWGLDRIDQASNVLDSSFVYDDKAGEGVRLYVVDSGVRDTHTEFSGRLGDDWSYTDDASDCNGHGTHVMGTAGGKTYGVAKKATLHAVRALDCEGNGNWADTAKGFEWAVKNADSLGNSPKPAVINMSIGGSKNTTINSAMTKAVNAGVTVVVAAGNGDVDACTVAPADNSNVIAVGASDKSDKRSYYNSSESSNYGKCVDIWAPGSSIKSAGHDGDSNTATMGGTSMASPHVAGAAAVYLSKNPASTPAQVRKFLVDNATTGKLTGIETGSPDKLLYMASVPSAPGNAGSNSVAVSIPDNNTTGVTSSITVSGKTGNAKFNSFVTVNLTHTYRGDIALDLIAPDGTVYALKAKDSDSSDNIVRSYGVEASSELANGTWKLRAKDLVANDTGKLVSWSISL